MERITIIEISSVQVITELTINQTQTILQTSSPPMRLTELSVGTPLQVLNSEGAGVDQHVSEVDPHSQYLNDSRGDNRYFTQAQIGDPDTDMVVLFENFLSGGGMT